MLQHASSRLKPCLSTRMLTTSAILLIGAATAACASSAPPAETATTPAAPATEEQSAASPSASPSVAPAIAFEEMSAPERMKHMKEVVTPHMAKVFQAADADEHASFSCSTCHGPGAKQGDFAMPSASLPLSDEDIAKHPEVTKFMMEKVVPEMAGLLGEAPYDPETQKGFGCYECHSRS